MAKEVKPINPLEELVEGLFGFCPELLNIPGYHRRHNNPLIN